MNRAARGRVVLLRGVCRSDVQVIFLERFDVAFAGAMGFDALGRCDGGGDCCDVRNLVFDRVLALNMFGTKTVLLICVVVFLMDPIRTDFLDLALLYSLMNFIGIVALLRFSEYGSFREEGAELGSKTNP